MAISKAEIETVLEATHLVEEHLERTRDLLVEPEGFRAFREQEAQLKALAESPVLNAIRDQQELLKDLVDPPALRALREHQELVKNLVDPPALKMLREQEALTRGLIESATLAEHAALVGGAIDSTVVRAMTADLQTIQLMTREMGESLMFAGNSVARSVFSKDFVECVGKIAADCHNASIGFGEALQHVAERLKPITVNLDGFADLFKAIDLSGFHENFKAIEDITLAAQSVFGTVKFESLGDLIGVGDPSPLQLQTYGLNKSFATYAAAIAAEPVRVIDAPFMARVPALAVYAQARFTRAITTHKGEEPVVHIWTDVQAETTAVIETLLPLLGPALLKSWKGGLATVRRRGDDWVRQASASLRYVLITALDKSAPKDKVLPHAKQKGHVSTKGEPTRRGQVSWLCQSLKNEAYRDMMVSELESAIETIDAMSTAVHRQDYPEIEEAFDRMCIRAEIALTDLLKIFEMRK